MERLKDHPIIAAFNFIGGVSGAIALLTIVFYGGALVEQVRMIDGRVKSLEASGSTSLQVHSNLDDARDGRIEERMKRIEDLIILLPERQVRMESKIDTLTERQMRIENKLDAAHMNKP